MGCRQTTNSAQTQGYQIGDVLLQTATRNHKHTSTGLPDRRCAPKVCCAKTSQAQSYQIGDVRHPHPVPEGRAVHARGRNFEHLQGRDNEKKQPSFSKTRLPTSTKWRSQQIHPMLTARLHPFIFAIASAACWAHTARRHPQQRDGQGQR